VTDKIVKVPGKTDLTGIKRSTGVMRSKIGNFALLSFVIFVLVSSTGCSLKDLLQSKTSDENAFMLLDKGYKLSDSQADALEDALKKNPDDYSVRVRLLAYYFKTIDKTPKETRRETILWLIKNRPDSEIWQTNLGLINSQSDAEGLLYQSMSQRKALPIIPLSETLTLTSICGLGQVVPAPIKSVIRHFRDEIDEHTVRGRCPSGVCPMA